jgi:hypothetical protein
VRLLAALLASVVLPACAHTALPAESSAELPASSLEPARAERLRALAPDFLARAERAQARANTASSPEAARDHAECVRLLLAAAELEAERIELERQLLAEELRRDAALQKLAAARYAALALQPAAAAKVPSQPAAAKKPSAESLVQKARLQVAAARALGAPPASLAQAERQIVRAIADPSQARAALEQAERVFAVARQPKAQ